VHLAQPQTFGGRVTRRRAERYRDDRLAMDRHLFAAIDRARVGRILYVSGTSYYGDLGVELRDESTAPNPKGWGPYIIDAVAAMERLIADGMPIVPVFPGYIYGGGSWFEQYVCAPMRAGKKLDTIAGRSRWGSPMHVDDCGRALLHLLDRGKVGERYFLVDDHPVQWSDIHRHAARALGVAVRTRPSPPWMVSLFIGPISANTLMSDSRLSNARLKATGFECRFPSIETGIPDVIAASQRAPAP
jgi:nucleoside-diphosphate-sugar epimerase